MVGAVDKLVGWAEASGAFVSIGTDPKSPRLFLNFHTAGSGRTYWPLAINPRPGKVALFLQYLKHHPAFVDDDRRLEFVEKMSAATGFAIDARLGGRPGFPVDRLLQPDVLEAVEDVLRWVTETADAVGG